MVNSVLKISYKNQARKIYEIWVDLIFEHVPSDVQSWTKITTSLHSKFTIHVLARIEVAICLVRSSCIDLKQCLLQIDNVNFQTGDFETDLLHFFIWYTPILTADDWMNMKQEQLSTINQPSWLFTSQLDIFQGLNHPSIFLLLEKQKLRRLRNWSQGPKLLTFWKPKKRERSDYPKRGCVWNWNPIQRTECHPVLRQLDCPKTTPAFLWLAGPS